MSTRTEHWERVHQGKLPSERSWFQPRPEVSLGLMEAAGIEPPAGIVDVGGGTSRLVDELLAKGFDDITVLDISPTALEEARERLGERADDVRWVASDVTEAELEGSFDLWHDRAAFHFLTDPEDRRRYVALLHRTLAPGGHAIVATFAEDGPDECSGLPVVRYSPDALAAELGDDLELLRARRELHVTPAGKEQSFVYCLFRRAAGAG